MSDLAALQRAFGRFLLSDDAAIAGAVESTAQLTAHERLGIYSSGYRARLHEVLRNDYPVLRGVLGGSAFTALADGYIGARPSQSFTLRDFGIALPGFVAQHAAAGEREFAAELAAFERAFVEAFDAPDAVPLQVSALAAVAPPEWPQLRFTPHPSVQTLTITCNTLPVWEAVKAQRSPPQPQRLDAPLGALVWRQDLTTVFRSLAGDELALWRLLAAGEHFAGMCDALTLWVSPEEVPLRAATLLRGWLAGGLLAGMAAG